MVAEVRSLLDNGLYTLPEAALYARVSHRMLSRWLFGSKAGNSVLTPQFGAEDRQVSFLDFVQTLAIREIRLQRKVPLSKLRQAVKVAKDRFNLDYPFARQHCTYLWGDEVVIAPPGEGFVEASGSSRGQRLFHFVESYLANLSFSAEGLAKLYQIYKHADIAIQMNPQLRFGEPLLPSGYSALSVWESFRAEGDLKLAAKVHGISDEEALTAYKFFVDYLGKTAA